MTLLFSLRTHRWLFEIPEDCLKKEVPSMPDEREARPMSWVRPVLMLLFSSRTLCWVSENLVDSLKVLIRDRGLSESFTGVFLLPLFGGVVEYLVAIKLARTDKLDFAIAIAAGSTLQVTTFVAPLLVISGYYLNQPMDFDFEPFELLAAAIALGATNIISNDDSTNWLEGFLLIVVYLVIGSALHYHT